MMEVCEEPPLPSVYNSAQWYNSFAKMAESLINAPFYLLDSDYLQKPYTGHDSEEDKDDE